MNVRQSILLLNLVWFAASPLALGQSMPSGSETMPAGAQAYAQAWLLDDVGPNGLVSSNGLSLIAP